MNVGAPSSDNSINSFYFEIHSSEEFGRYLVAKEDIDAKTLILSEAPVVFGPTDDKDFEKDVVFLFCLACCKQLSPNNGDNSNSNSSSTSASDTNGCDNRKDIENCGVDTSRTLYHCSKCGWPVCDIICEKVLYIWGYLAPIHSDLECRFFTLLHYQRSTYPPPHLWLMYKSIIVLRLLLLIQRDPEGTWTNFLEKLEHHSKIREEKENCVRADELVLENLTSFTAGLEEKRMMNGNGLRKKKNSKKKFNLPFINDPIALKRIIGTMNVNSFCANNNANKRIARCMFRTASLFAHSCAPNCSWTIQISDLPAEPNQVISNRKRRNRNGVVKLNRSSSSSFKIPPQIQIYTALPIKKGEIVTIAYSTRNIFYGTLKRQISMESVGHFICKCRRCMDSTELGTYMSSIRCFKCESGFLVPIDPSNEECEWVCSNYNNNNDDDDCNNYQFEDKEDDKITCCGCKCSVGKVVYFVTKIQDKIDLIRSKELDWFEEQERLHNLFEKYFGRELHRNHYLLFEISTRMVELLYDNLMTSESNCVEGDTRNKRAVILADRFLFHVKYMIEIANAILPGFNNYQDQLRLYLNEAEAFSASVSGLECRPP